MKTKVEIPETWEADFITWTKKKWCPTHEQILDWFKGQFQPIDPQEPKCEECPSKQFYEANTAKIMDKIEQPEIIVTDVCNNWMPDKGTSATRCANCGKDRWQHEL